MDGPGTSLGEIWGSPREEFGGIGGGGPETPSIPPIFFLSAAPEPLPSLPPGGAPRAPLLEPPQASVPPPPLPDQSASVSGADGQVWELLYWRAPERSALALLVALVVLGCLSRFSAISVGAYGALAVLAVTVPLRLRQVALRALGTAPPEPLARAQPEVPGVLSLSTDPVPVPRAQPEVPGVLSPEQQQRWARYLARHVVTATRTLTRLFLVHSVPESLKFAFLFYLLTYVGAVCNGLTLLGAGVICAFTFPVLYRRHQLPPVSSMSPTAPRVPDVPRPRLTST
ncbi:reticulon-1-A-like isoform X2 [Corvus kubaryi]|uniref:reticulon-1-A-like isoform X2 n=1 Tax=Corvus kubaryi TaxID=68294 RepID=UPI001C05D323|nr:reticulon-1-A-like isoform X2 [Corvus kubaryi]